MNINTYLKTIITLFLLNSLTLANTNNTTPEENNANLTTETLTTENTEEINLTPVVKTNYSLNENENLFYVKLDLGVAMFSKLSSNDNDYLFNQNFSLNSNNAYIFALSLGKHFNKNFALEFTSSYSSLTYKMSDTTFNKETTETYKGNYVEISNLGFMVDVYYNYYFNNVLFNVQIPAELQKVSPFIATGVGMEILTPTYGHKQSEDGLKRLNNNYFTGVFNIKLGANYNLTKKHTIGVDYTYKIRASEVLDTKLSSFTSNNFNIYYLYRF